MKLFKTIGVLLLLGAGFMACTNDEASLISKNIVVEGYLQVNRPVTNFRITQLVPLGSSTNDPVPINNASVFIIHNTQRYALTPSVGDSGYYQQADSALQIISGEIYLLEVNHEGQTVTAQTQAPIQPSGLSITKDTLRIAPIRSPFDIGNRVTEDLEISWNNPNQDYHLLVIRSIEPNPQPIDINNITNGAFSFPTDPIRGNNSQLVGSFLRQYGSQQIVLYRINQEYVDLYNTANQDSRNLNEPLSNIVNGLGIFTCINAASASFFVIRP